MYMYKQCQNYRLEFFCKLLKTVYVHVYMTQGWASRCPCSIHIYTYMYMYVCLSGLWFGGLLYFSFLSVVLKLVCDADVYT